MPRITQDPHLAEVPDFASDAYDVVGTALATAQNITKEVAIARLAEAWKTENDARKVEWNRQVREEEEAEAEARRAREEAEKAEREERRQEEEADKREREKKKPKLKEFVANKPVKDTSQLRPSRYAIHKLEEREYIELQYFTLEGCTEAAKFDRTVAQDAFTFAKSEDTLILKPMASYKPSSKVIPDKDLTWRQMSIARASLLHYMSKTGWPDQHVVSLAEFYLNLESHPTRLEANGDAILLMYQAQVRREWHEALRSTSDELAFDISIINKKRVEAIASLMWNARRAEGVLRLVNPSHKLELKN